MDDGDDNDDDDDDEIIAAKLIVCCQVSHSRMMPTRAPCGGSTEGGHSTTLSKNLHAWAFPISGGASPKPIGRIHCARRILVYWQCRQRAWKSMLVVPIFQLIVVQRSDDILKGSAKFRSKGRIPALCWVHPGNGATLHRSAQPRTGFLRFTRCKEDEALVQSIRLRCDGIVRPPSAIVLPCIQP